MYTSHANFVGGSVAAGISVFGSDLPIMKAPERDEAVSLANDTEYGLTSSIDTTNLSSATRAVKVLSFGETYVDGENFEAMQGFHAGARKSGIGGADGKHEHRSTQVAYVLT